jgi:hypothetical protein
MKQKQKNNEIKTPKTILTKPKEGEKEKQQEKIEINKIFPKLKK